MLQPLEIAGYRFKLLPQIVLKMLRYVMLNEFSSLYHSKKAVISNLRPKCIQMLTFLILKSLGVQGHRIKDIGYKVPRVRVSLTESFVT